MIDHHSYIHNLSSSEIKALKKFSPDRDSNHDLCDTSAVLYQPYIWSFIYSLADDEILTKNSSFRPVLNSLGEQVLKDARHGES